MLNVLHIGKYFPPFSGGMENYLRGLMAAQARQGLRSAALVHQSTLNFRGSDETYVHGDLGLRVVRAPVWARCLFTPISPTFPRFLNRLLKRQQPDLLHLHMPNVSAFWVLFLPRARKIPWLVHWHADVLASSHSLGLRLFYRLYRPFERAILARSLAIIATSPPYLQSSVVLGPFLDKCHVIPLGLDPASLPLPPPDSPTGGNGGSLRVLAVGRLTYYKGFEVLIRAVAANENVVLHLVGEGALEGKLRELARSLQVGRRVVFHGHLPDARLASQLAACDCVCLPSIERTEAFGMVLLEAMYCGKATIASDVPGSGMGWIVDDGVTGLLVEPGDCGALASALARLQSDRSEARSLGVGGRAKFQQAFHIDQSASGITGLYRDILGRHPVKHETPGG